MGCDIHVVLERRKRGASKWIGIYTTDAFPGGRPLIAQRDYAFFAQVANVRGQTTSGNYPRNVPEDISALAWQQYMESPTDHHSASHMTAAEFCGAHRLVNPELSRAEHAAYDLLGIFDDGQYDHRVVFWFDN